MTGFDVTLGWQQRRIDNILIRFHFMHLHLRSHTTVIEYPHLTRKDILLCTYN